MSLFAGTFDCYNQSDRGMTYSGDMAVTLSGLPCQSWVSQTPHVHAITPLNRPQLENHNNCRNPDGRGLRPWCYTTDSSTRWEYCAIPVCASTGLPSYIYIIIGVGSAVFLLIVASAVAICCCKCNKSKRFEVLANGKNMKFLDESVALSSPNKVMVEVSGNPLYAVNPLSEQPIEYDGMKLPECPRDSIFYIKDLGQGNFGVVVQAEITGIEQGKEKSMVAIKVLKEGATSQVKKEFFREATLMKTFDHPNIVKLLGVCVDQEPLCMIFEFMELGDLNNYLRKNSPNDGCQVGSDPSLERYGQLANGSPARTTLSAHQLVCIAIDIAAGLDYLAQNRFVHRDLASRNCLVSRSLQVKISDFGLSQDIYSTDYFKMGDAELLPIRWMPPEAILYARFTTQSDIWSFGVVLWEIFSFGIQPYFSMSNEQVVQHVRGRNVMSCPEGCPQEIYDLMIDCWAMEPSERPNASEIHAGLQRWSPNLSATLQNMKQPEPTCDYQNMGTIREYTEKGLPRVVEGEMVGQLEMSMSVSEKDDAETS